MPSRRMAAARSYWLGALASPSPGTGTARRASARGSPPPGAPRWPPRTAWRGRAGSRAAPGRRPISGPRARILSSSMRASSSLPAVHERRGQEVAGAHVPRARAETAWRNAAAARSYVLLLVVDGAELHPGARIARGRTRRAPRSRIWASWSRPRRTRRSPSRSRKPGIVRIVLDRLLARSPAPGRAGCSVSYTKPRADHAASWSGSSSVAFLGLGDPPRPTAPSPRRDGRGGECACPERGLGPPDEPHEDPRAPCPTPLSSMCLLGQGEVGHPVTPAERRWPA